MSRQLRMFPMKNPDQKFSRFNHSMNRFCALILSIGLMSFAACFPQADPEKESESEGEVIRSNESESDSDSDSDSNIDSKNGAGVEKEKAETSDATTVDGSQNDSEGSQESEKTEDQKVEVAQEEGQGKDKEEEVDQSTWIQLSFKGANVDMIVEWLSKETGKSIIKHPRVNCQLTIVSSSKLPKSEALKLVYNALSLEGFTTVETARSIMLLPVGEEPKMGPEMISDDFSDAEERQRIFKVFELKHVKASEIKDKFKGVLSANVQLESDDNANKIIVTDYAQNIRLLSDLIEELDVVSASGSVIEIILLKYADAEELSELLGSVLSGDSRRSSSSRSSYSRDRSSSSSGGIGSGDVRFWPDRNANRIIVTAPEYRIKDIREMIETLDVEKPGDLAIRVMPLTNMDAEDLIGEIGPLFEKLSASSLKGMIEISANSRSNSLIILSNQSNFESIEELVKSLDTEDALQKVVQVFTLLNADASDVATQLQELFEDQSGSSSSRYNYYSYSRSRGGNNDEKMTFVADQRRNSVIVQGPPSNMQSVAKMVETLDEPISGESLAPQIFTLKFVSSIEIEEVLNELFSEGQTQQRNYWDPYGFGRGGSSSGDGVGRLYGKVKITSESYSNSIIVTSNSRENLDAVEDVIKQLDVPSQAGETTLRLPLKYSKAVEIANGMNILFAKAGSPPMRPTQQQPNQGNQGNQNQNASGADDRNFEMEQEAKEETYFPWLGGPAEDNRGVGGRTTTTRPVSDLVGKVRIVPDPRTNSLLVTSSVHFLPQVLKLIQEMDRPTAQVLINTKIIEVSTDFRKKLGTRWSPDGAATFDAEDMDGSILAGSETVFRNVFTGTEVGDSNKSGIITTSLNLDVLLQFMRKNSDAKVMAEPQLNIADNEIGKLFVGSQVPYVSGSNTTPQGGLSSQIEYKNVGIILEVTPKINSADEVSLSIRLEASSIRAGETIQGSPIFDTREFRTDLVVGDGQTLVLGGIIQNEESQVIRKVPLLGDIPGLGYLFKKKDDVKRDVELMVFLRPVITRSPEDVLELMNDLDVRTPKIKGWQDEMDNIDKPSDSKKKSE